MPSLGEFAMDGEMERKYLWGGIIILLSTLYTGVSLRKP
jgi:hypothetical protein